MKKAAFGGLLTSKNFAFVNTHNITRQYPQGHSGTKKLPPIPDHTDKIPDSTQ